MRKSILVSLWLISVLSGISACGPTLEERQQKAKAQYQIGVAEFNRGNIPEALKSLENAKENYPNDPRIHNSGLY